MAEFSQEYQSAIGSTDPGDFSIIEEFKRLMEGMSIKLVCEGFGSHSIKNIDGQCYLVFFDKKSIPIAVAVSNVKSTN